MSDPEPEDRGAAGPEEKGAAEPETAAPVEPSPAGGSELMPLMIAMDFMVQDSAPDGKGLLVKPADFPELTPDEYDAMLDDVQKVVRTLRVLDAHKPCLFRAIKLWAGVH